MPVVFGLLKTGIVNSYVQSHDPIKPADGDDQSPRSLSEEDHFARDSPISAVLEIDEELKLDEDDSFSETEESIRDDDQVMDWPFSTDEDEDFDLIEISSPFDRFPQLRDIIPLIKPHKKPTRREAAKFTEELLCFSDEVYQ